MADLFTELRRSAAGLTRLVGDTWEGLVSLLKGMDITLRTMFRGVNTVQYPKEKLTLPERWRGVLTLENSKCTACGACVRACPSKLLAVEGHREEGKKGKVVDSLPWLAASCAFCDMCVNACPMEALAFHHDYETVSYTREELYIDLATKKTAEVGDLPTGFAPGRVATIASDGTAMRLNGGDE